MITLRIFIQGKPFIRVKTIWSTVIALFWLIVHKTKQLWNKTKNWSTLSSTSAPMQYSENGMSKLTNSSTRTNKWVLVEEFVIPFTQYWTENETLNDQFCS